MVVDIGGTTTDLALILSGQPLLSSKGARVENQLTQVRTLAVKSVPVGGDSALQQDGKGLIIGTGRLGPAYCMGGPAPTPTDALRVLGLTELGDPLKAEEAMTDLGEALNLSARDTAGKVIEMVVERISSEVNNMFLDWEQEPAYLVWEVLQKKGQAFPRRRCGRRSFRIYQPNSRKTWLRSLHPALCPGGKRHRRCRGQAYNAGQPQG